MVRAVPIPKHNSEKRLSIVALALLFAAMRFGTGTATQQAHLIKCPQEGFLRAFPCEVSSVTFVRIQCYMFSRAAAMASSCSTPISSGVFSRPNR